jgi:hypothetical protein
MSYGSFRKAGLFAGFGVVEAGCNTIIAERLEQSGIRWTTNGATGIFTLRCEQASGTWDDSRLAFTPTSGSPNPYKSVARPRRLGMKRIPMDARVC